MARGLLLSPAMRKISLLFVVVLGGCDLLEAATAEKPNGTQQQAIGDFFGQVGTVAAVLDDPGSTSNSDLATAMSFEHFGRMVTGTTTKPALPLRLAKPGPLPGCVVSSGNNRNFNACDVILDDGRACSVSGTLTRTPGETGNSYAGTLNLGGGGSCPVASVTIDMYLEGPTDSPTRASGNLHFAWSDPSGDSFDGTAVVDEIAVTGKCSVPSSGELRVNVGGKSVTFSFHDSPGCGIIYVE
jgi:hypothetical protein